MLHLVQHNLNKHVDVPNFSIKEISQDGLLSEADLKMLHETLNAQSKRRNCGAETANVVLQAEQNSWLQSYPDISRYFENIPRDDAESSSTGSADTNINTFGSFNERYHCPLYSYFNTASDNSTNVSSFESQGLESLYGESCGGLFSPKGTQFTPTPSLESGLLSMVETAWKSSAPKREHSYHKKGKHVYLKILATQLVSGTIIGRGGKGFNWFRRKSKIDDILLSMPWELYPRTELRTMFLEGTTSAVVKATCIIGDLMLCKYAPQQSLGQGPTDKMLVIVVLPTFARAVMETIRDRTDDSVVSVTLFEGSSDDKEFIAIIKGVKTKVKSIIGALATTVADTVERKDYCQIAYPSPDGLSSQVLPNIKSTVKNGKKSDMAEIEKMLPQDLLGNDDTYMGATHSHKDTEMDKYMNNTPKWDMKDGVCSLDSTIGANDEQLSVEISAAALLAQTSPRILKYPVNMTILIPADKASEVVSLSRASKCYCSTTPTDDPKTVALSVNGSLQESTSLVSVIISVIH